VPFKSGSTQRSENFSQKRTRPTRWIAYYQICSIQQIWRGVQHLLNYAPREWRWSKVVRPSTFADTIRGLVGKEITLI